MDILQGYKGIPRRKMVGMTGFEPAAPSPPDLYATKLRHIPLDFIILNIILEITFLLYSKTSYIANILLKLLYSTSIYTELHKNT